MEDSLSFSEASCQADDERTEVQIDGSFNDY